eukprot:8071896-Pyramimonas_sp.AAC.1
MRNPGEFGTARVEGGEFELTAAPLQEGRAEPCVDGPLKAGHHGDLRTKRAAFPREPPGDNGAHRSGRGATAR